MSASDRQAVLEPTFVLHSRAYRNTSALLEVLGREHGRVGVIARGVRTQRSKTAGLLQPFQPLAVSWRRRGELASLDTVESAGRAFTLRGRRLVSGLYANELLMRLLARDDPQPGLFERYFQLLDALAGTTPEAVALRGFERDLLAVLGYGLALQADTADQALVPERWYRYDLQAGATPVASQLSKGLVVPGRVLIGLANDPIDPEVARASRDLMRAALQPHLGARPLKSRELYARYPTTGDQRYAPSSGQS